MALGREGHALFVLVLLLFVFTSLNHLSGTASSHGDASKGGVADRLEPFFGAKTRLGRLGSHLRRSEEIYQEMVAQRPILMATYENPASPNKKLFPADSEAAQGLYPFTIWDLLPAAFNCAHSMRRLGRMGGGAKWVCGLEKFAALPKSRKSTALSNEVSLQHDTVSVLPRGHQPGCIIYSFGIGTDSSFEEQLLDRTPNCRIWGYGFSVDEFGPRLKEEQANGRAFFTKAGIAATTDTSKGPPLYSIQDLMIINGHDHIDIVKMDIEGYEFETMLSVIKYFGERGEEIPISELLVEVHLDPGRISVDDLLDWWRVMEDAGFRATWSEPNLLVSTIPLHDGRPRYAEYTFINIKDYKNALLK